MNYNPDVYDVNTFLKTLLKTIVPDPQKTDQQTATDIVSQELLATKARLIASDYLYNSDSDALPDLDEVLFNKENDISLLNAYRFPKGVALLITITGFNIPWYLKIDRQKYTFSYGIQNIPRTFGYRWDFFKDTMVSDIMVKLTEDIALTESAGSKTCVMHGRMLAQINKLILAMINNSHTSNILAVKFPLDPEFKLTLKLELPEDATQSIN